ncbi:hypothetical protein COI93_11085 [Bacillus cereus]|uniref:Uncharacterized protein n=1 Tax=Bacillus cereus TaxID=1396 RepID=A0A2B0MIU3_BACCE|nr:hypothetical protein COI93_11085 [Bacillus cereus]
MLLNEIKVPPEELERISKNFHRVGIEAKMKHENLKKDIDMLNNIWYGLSAQNFFISFNLSKDYNVFFDHIQIEEVLFTGYENEEELSLRKELI